MTAPVPCRQCGEPVPHDREEWATPVCYACIRPIKGDLRGPVEVLARRVAAPRGEQRGACGGGAKVTRSPMSRSVAAVLREAERWGVTVQFGAPHKEPSYAGDVDAPMHDGYVDDVKRIVYVVATREEFEQFPHAAPALMHEVNHAVLGCAAKEDGSMLALDHEAYRRLRLAGWSNWMKGYELGAWSNGSTKYRNGCLRYAYKKAAQEKVIVDGKPNYDGAGRARVEAVA